MAYKTCAIFVAKEKIYKECNSFRSRKNKYSEFTEGKLCAKESCRMSKKIILILATVGCLFLGNLNILAAGSPFIEIQQNEIDIVPITNDLTNKQSNPSLLACNVGIGIANNGLLISFDTDASHVADEIGVKNVVLQEKTWYGWKDIPISNYCDYNSDYYMGDIVYTLATKGTTYRVKCTHYAKFGSTELTLDNTSSELVYN